MKLDNQCYRVGGLGQNSVRGFAKRSSLSWEVPLSWEDAEALCQSEDAHLTSLSSEVMKFPKPLIFVFRRRGSLSVDLQMPLPG